MKTLWIIRHAHASGSYSLNDHSRKLSSLGEADARKIAKFLSIQPDAPQLIVHSDAMRTTQTAHAIQSVLGVQATAASVLYNADVDDLLEMIKYQSDNIESLAIVAHNPGVSYLATLLGKKNIGLEPAGIAKIVVPGNMWETIEQQAQLEFFIQADTIPNKW